MKTCFKGVVYSETFDMVCEDRFLEKIYVAEKYNIEEIIAEVEKSVEEPDHQLVDTKTCKEGWNSDMILIFLLYIILSKICVLDS
jgi:hypothetical protein